MSLQSAPARRADLSARGKTGPSAKVELSISPARKSVYRRLLPWILPVAGLLLWEVGARAGWINARLMPPPSRVLATLVDLARNGDLATHVAATSGRVLVGFGAGAVAGTILATLTGASTTTREIFDPTVQALRAIPSIAWVPLFILWFGIFEGSKIILIAVGVFFPVYLGVLGGLLSVDRKMIEVGRAFGLGPLRLAWRILLPSIMPAWVTALRAGLGLGFMFVVAAELMGASEGVGYLLLDGQQVGKPDQILAAILVFAAMGKLSDMLLVGVAAPLLRWQDLSRERL